MSALLQPVPIRPRDPQEGHRRCAEGINGLLGYLQGLYNRIKESGVIYGNAGTFTNGQVITGWSNSAVYNEDTQLLPDPVLGTITVNQAGVYDVTAYGEFTGSSNNAYYGLRLNRMGNLIYLGMDQWNNATPGMAQSVHITLPMNAGDTIQMEAYCQTGSLTLGGDASLDVRLNKEA